MNSEQLKFHEPSGKLDEGFKVRGEGYIEKFEEKYAEQEAESEQPVGGDIDFNKLLEELEGEQYLAKTGAAEIVEQIQKIKGKEGFSPEIFKDILVKILQRMQNECGDLGSLAVLEEAWKLCDFEKSARKYPEDHILHNGAYDFTNGKILISAREEEFTALMTIMALAVSGSDHKINVLHHENIHAKQYGPPTLRNIIKTRFERLFRKEKTILTETQSMVSANSRNSREIQSLRDLYEKLKQFTVPDEVINTRPFNKKGGGYNVIISDRAVDYLIVGHQEVRQLYALGLDDAVIADLVKNARWNKKNGVFNTLHNAIEELRDARGLESEDMENLVLKDILERKIVLYKAQRIAREEIDKVVDQLDE